MKLKILTICLTLFAVACVTAGALLGIYYFAPEKLFECYDSGQDLYAAARYYCLPNSPSENWIECSKTKYVWRYLRNEKVKRIAFWSVDDYDGNSMNNLGWEINEPEKIKQTLQSINVAKKAQNVSIVWLGRMHIITDKHKFIVPVEVSDTGVYGLDWTSFELRKQLWKWGYDHKVYQYDLPSKEQTVAILLYPSPLKPLSPPLAIFGDKKLAEKLLFKKDYFSELVRLRLFGVEFKKEAGKYIPASAELAPKKVFEGREWLENMMDAYNIALKEAEEKEKYFPMKLDSPAGRIVFMTEDKDYWKQIGIDSNTVYDDYIKSEKLKTYFDELGLTKELLAEKH